MKYVHLGKLIFMALILSCITSLPLLASPIVKSLDGAWRFREARSNNWYPASVPGAVHTDLIANKLIEDPYFRLNERGLQWIDKEDWVYETTVSLTDEMLAQDSIDLVFKGLDTYADVYLNEKLILRADNMFRQWRVAVKVLFHSGENSLRVYFHSPIKMDIPKWDALPYHYEASNDQSENGGVFEKKVSVFARKAGYHYGWDWGPRLVTSGIWRSVLVEAWSKARINDVFIHQKEVTTKKALLDGQVSVKATTAGQAVVSMLDAVTGRSYARQEVLLAKGDNIIHLNFVLNNPKLWWTNELGSPYRYQFKTVIAVNGQTLDSKTAFVGIRSLKIVHQPDKEGHTFYVELNGRPVFMKGANYIPQDNFLPRVTSRRYEKMIGDAASCHFNMLRVWGGGVYEDDTFYDLCDEKGILVWQDFMFACSLYPAEGAFMENIRQEAVDNVCRLRNHACIALWCGNNECNDAWYGWGWKKRYEAQNPEYAKKIRQQYEDTYDVVLPEVVLEYMPGTFYWPSSPFAFGDGMSNDKDGDRHYWSVWHGRKPIEDYNKERSRFFSEYGFQSFPDLESVQRYAPDSLDWNIYSEVMMSHQRGGDQANKLIETYLLNEYRQPKDFSSFLYMNQVLQGDAIKTAIEAHRRDMPYCMGTLFWQIDDCWPVASWSSIDYYGRWKALQYYSRNVYRDILVSPISKEGKLDVYIVSDRMKVYPAVLDVKVMKLTGELVNEVKKTVKVAPNASGSYLNCRIDDLLKGVSPGEVVVVARLKGTSDGTLYSNHYFLEKQKDMMYPQAQLKYSIKPAAKADTYEVQLSTDNFARAVYVSTGDAEATFSDNYMDILPGQEVTIQVYSKLPFQTLQKQLKAVSLSEAYVSDTK